MEKDVEFGLVEPTIGPLRGAQQKMIDFCREEILTKIFSQPLKRIPTGSIPGAIQGH
jgi:hypothetical protein